jgi:aldose 1-epimerase
MGAMDAPTAGRLDDDTPVHTCHLAADGIAVDILDYGATIQRLEVPDRAGATRNVVLGQADVAAYRRSSAFFGCAIGRYANRIAGGRFTLDGVDHQLSTNEGPNLLHGGPDGFDKRLWSITDLTDTRLVLDLVSPDGDQGFPGELAVTVTYAVSPGELRIDYAATTSAPTVVNLTNHTYHNLEGEDAWSVEHHLLTIHADEYTPTTADYIPTGLAPVEGTAFDWREPRRIGDRLRTADDQVLVAGGLDHNMVIRGEGLREHATLTAPASGITLTVLSDQPGNQAYTGNHLDGRIVGTSGRVYRQAAGICLETQHFPDSPNRPEFPSTVLRPGETFASSTLWRFTTAG